MSQYAKECIFCKARIHMSDKTGNWVPYNQDWSLHDCKKQSNDIGVDGLLEKLESMGIKIDLHKLRNLK
jgi:hypothetical protein